MNSILPSSKVHCVIKFKSLVLPSLLLALPVFGGTPSFKEPLAPAAAPEAWEFRMGLPLWVSGLDGDAGARGRVAPVDVAFADIIPQIDMAAALSFEARRGRWGFLTNGIYMDLSNVAGSPGPLIDDLKVQIKQLMLDGAVSYAVVESNCTSVEMLAGVRYNHIKLGLTIQSQSDDFSADKTESWVDPYVGMLARTHISESVSLVGKADIGGFDVGSKLTWQLYGGVEFQISESCHIGVGYRYLSVDYASDGFIYDMNTSGPQLEVEFTF